MNLFDRFWGCDFYSAGSPFSCLSFCACVLAHMGYCVFLVRYVLTAQLHCVFSCVEVYLSNGNDIDVQVCVLFIKDLC